MPTQITIRIPILTSKNYITWRRKAENYLFAQHVTEEYLEEKLQITTPVSTIVPTKETTNGKDNNNKENKTDEDIPTLETVTTKSSDGPRMPTYDEKANAFVQIANSLSDELEHLQDGIVKGDIITLWRKIKNNFEIQSSKGVGEKMIKLFNSTFEPGEDFAKHVVKLERLASEIHATNNKLFANLDENLKIALQNSLLRKQHDKFAHMINYLCEQKADENFKTWINILEPVARREQENYRQEAHAATSKKTKAIMGRILNPKMKLCFSIQRGTDCRFGDKCHFSHDNTQKSHRPGYTYEIRMRYV